MLFLWNTVRFFIESLGILLNVMKTFVLENYSSRNQMKRLCLKIIHVKIKYSNQSM